jgi:threonine aldolase
MSKPISLASDNWSPAHPLVMEAVVQANQGFAAAYGLDEWTQEAVKVIQSLFRRDSKAHILPTGTGANLLALKQGCRSHESVLCTDISHINYHEAGAAEALVGCKLLAIPHLNGKLSLDRLVKRLENERSGGKHSTYPRLVTIAQPTEVGTLYTLDELRELAKICKQHDLLLHMDGSRLYNAAAALETSLNELVDAASADLLSLGGTKNGLMGAEALVIFNQELWNGSEIMQKQTLQLASKMRYLSAQYIPFLQNELWRELAMNANRRAQEIASLVKRGPQLQLTYPVESNQIFFTLPPAWVSPLQEEVKCGLWRREPCEIRFVTSWNTTSEEVAAVESVLTKLS